MIVQELCPNHCRGIRFFSSLAACGAIVVSMICGMARAAESPVISFASLLDEMVDRGAMARWPSPEFTCKQASSYDRRSKKPGNEDWFANQDWSNFIRAEKVAGKNGDRTEYVMLDEAGPGAIVRIWAGGYTDKGVIRFYIDGAAEPVLSGTADEIIGGNKYFPKPLAAVHARGRNLYAPIPYAKHIKITYDGPLPKPLSNPGNVGFWYNINYRTYPAGTKVESFSVTVLNAAKVRLTVISNKLLHPERYSPQPGEESTKSLSKDERPWVQRLTLKAAGGGAAVTEIKLHLAADDLEAALRETRISVRSDHQIHSVWCPVGDFFGSGVGINPFQDWWRRVEKDKTLTCYWVMPFREECIIELENISKRDLGRTICTVVTSPWRWDNRSLYFRANYGRNPAINTAKHSDFNYITVHGRGVYMGDTLAVYNPVAAWWGEGDEKVWMDGESFPSHFGTGSEDYYGYAWGSTDLFSAPFHSQPRAGKRNQGHTTNTRVRCLDRIPFKKSLQFDMEIWNWAKTKADYSVITYFYAEENSSWFSRGNPESFSIPGRLPEKK